jgi:hypothetical protein
MWVKKSQNIKTHTIIAIKNTINRFLPAWYLPAGTINAADNKLEDASSSCELWGIWCGALVVAAVIAELVIAWIEPPYITFLTDSAIADAAIAIGVGEVLFGMRNNRIQTELRNRSNKALQEATDRATILERIALPRRISPQGEIKSIEYLRPIAAGLHVHLDFQSGDAEAFIFANDIARTFRMAGCPPVTGGPNSFPYEVVIGVHYSAVSPALESQIRTAFATLEIPCQTRAWNPLWLQPISQTAPRRNIRIFVGPKPPPDLPFPYSWTAQQSNTTSTTDNARE